MTISSYAEMLATESGERADDTPLRAWPAPPAAPAFHGLAGDVVRLWEPFTEADRVAVLAHTVIFFGNAVGRSPHIIAGGDRHGLNENALFLGSTSTGRKGTSAAVVRTQYRAADPSFDASIVSGLSTGEGLIHVVRDPEGEQAIEEKRLCVLESEFATPLRAMRREGNTLSPVIRCAWDGGRLRTMTRAAPLVASNAHISIVGHITPDELQQQLDANETTNGLLNRFLIIAVKRSRSLPDGASPAWPDVERLGRQLHDRMVTARLAGELKRDHAARDLWHDVYDSLSEERAGRLGKALSRAAPHVLRLSGIYALLDDSSVIRRGHLESALAFWRYVEESTAFFLGDSLENPDADLILRALRERPDGMSKSDLYKLKSGHLTKERAEIALRYLVKNGLAYREEKHAGEKKGRPVEWWMAAKYAKEAKEAKEAPSGESSEPILSLISPNSQFSDVLGPSSDASTGSVHAKEAKEAKPPVQLYPCPGGCGLEVHATAPLRNPCAACREKGAA